MDDTLPDANYVRNKIYESIHPSIKKNKLDLWSQRKRYDLLKFYYDRHIQYVKWQSEKTSKIELLNSDFNMLEHYDYDYIFKMYEKCSNIYNKYMNIVELIFKCNGKYIFDTIKNQRELCVLLKDNGFKVKIDEENIFVSIY
jgi:hypothetical protein